MPVSTDVQRRRSFYLKTDLEVSDEILRGLVLTNPRTAALRVIELRDLLAARFGDENVQLHPLAMQGTFHIVHGCQLSDGTQYVVRSGLPEIFSDDRGFLLEDWAHKVLSSVGLPALKVCALDFTQQDVPYAWMVLSKAPGRCLAEASDVEQDSNMRLFALGATLRRVHAVALNGYGPVDTHSLSRIESAAGVYCSWQDFALCRWREHGQSVLGLDCISCQELKSLEVFADKLFSRELSIPHALLHGDPGNANFFAEADKVTALIDWEDAVVGDPLYDLAFWASFHPRRRWPAFFSGYGSDPLTGGLTAQRFAFYFARVIFAKVILRHRFGYQDAPGRPTARQRVEQALALCNQFA